MTLRSSKIRNIFLFEGYLQKENKKIVPKPNSISIVQNEFVFSTNTKVNPQENFVCYRTNINGVLYEVAYPCKKTQKSKQIKHISSNKIFFRPPVDIFQYAWAYSGKDWGKAVSRYLDSKKIEGVSLKKINIYKRHLKEPYKNPKKGSNEEKYNTFYANVGNKEKLSGYVIPKIRAVYFVFSSEKFIEANIDLILLEDGKEKQNFKSIVSVDSFKVQSQIFKTKTKQQKANDAVTEKEVKTTYGVDYDDPNDAVTEKKVKTTYGVVYGGPNELVEGLYRIKISNLKIKDADKWGNQTAKNKSYEFTEKLRFNIKNSAGEFDIIQADPISVEEAVMTQFPAQYSHLVAIAKKKESYPATNEEFKLSQAIQPWANRIAWTYEKAKLSVGLVNADSNNKFGWILGQAIWTAIKPKSNDIEALEYTKRGVDLSFSANSAYVNWQLFKESLQKFENTSEMQHVKELIFENTDLKKWDKYKAWSQFASMEKIDDDVILNALVKISDHGDDLDEFLATSGIAKKENLVKSLGEAGSRIEKGIVAIDVAVNTYQFAKKVAEIVGTHEKLNENMEGFKSLLDQYKDLDGVCREGIGNLERYRFATVAGKMKLNSEYFVAFDKALDVALGVLTAVPPTSIVAGLLLVIKGSASAISNLWTTGCQYFDKLYFDQYFTEMSNNKNLLSGMLNSSEANQKLIDQDALKEEEGKDDLSVQYRLRAEAISGLVSLLTRAGFVNRDAENEAAAKQDDNKSNTKQNDKKLAKKNDNIYLGKIKKYNLELYIKEYILGENWTHNIKPIIPVSLYSQWMYLNSNDVFSTQDKFYHYIEEKGRVEIAKDIAKKSLLPFGWPAYSIMHATNYIQSDTAKANFHKYFPIHTMDAESTKDFVKAFKTTYMELDKNCLEYTCIYRRDKGLSDEKASGMDNLGWEPINKAGTDELDQLKAISPFDKIRVLIILKEDVDEAMYPVSLQLVEDKGNLLFRTKGPIYKEVIKSIDPYLLDCEKKWKGSARLGCVIYPFYQLLDSYVPGTKPMVDFNSWDPFESIDLDLNEKNLIDSKPPERVDYKTSDLYVEARLKYYDDFEKKIDIKKQLLSKKILQSRLSDLEYGFKIKLGSKRTEQEITIGAAGNKKTTLKRYKMSIDINDKDQRRLLTKSFLQNKSTTVEYPKLFIKNKGNDPLKWTDFGVGPCLIKIGGSDAYILPDKDEYLVENFDWNTTVEFTVLVWADQIHEQNYKNNQIDWKETYFPIETTLTNTTGINTKGPKYTSTLKYIGKMSKMFEKKGFTVKFNDPAVTPDFDKHDGAFPKEIGNIIKTLSLKSGTNGAEILRRIRDIASSSKHKGRISLPATHLFAANFKMSYHTPEVDINKKQSEEIKSIRPFGNLFKGDLYSDDPTEKPVYKYSLRDFKTGGKVGLNEEIAVSEPGLISLTTEESTFSFPVPKDHKEIKKWAYLSKTEFEYWTMKKADVKAPVLPKITK